MELRHRGSGGDGAVAARHVACHLATIRQRKTIGVVAGRVFDSAKLKVFFLLGRSLRPVQVEGSIPLIRHLDIADFIYRVMFRW